MATTVAQHPVTAFTAPVNGSSPIDADEVTANDSAIRTAYNAHDADTGIHVQSSVFGSRPAAGTSGRKFITVDALSAPAQVLAWYDDGTNWYEVDYLRNSGGTLSGALTVSTGGITVAAGGLTVTTSLTSTAALATPSALSATQFTAFASTVSGATLMGYGTTHDVALKNRAGTTVLGVTANTSDVTLAGALAVTGIVTATVLTSASAVTVGTTAATSLALQTNGTPHITISSAGNITFSGGSVGGMGSLAIGGALTGVTTLATSSTINSQTISATASFTGTVAIATAALFAGTGTIATAGKLRLTNSNDPTTNGITWRNVANSGNLDLYVDGADMLRFQGNITTGNTGGYHVNAVKVIGAQGAAVADATDAASVIARLNDLLSRLRTHGLIAT